MTKEVQCSVNRVKEEKLHCEETLGAMLLQGEKGDKTAKCMIGKVDHLGPLFHDRANGKVFDGFLCLTAEGTSSSLLKASSRTPSVVESFKEGELGPRSNQVGTEFQPDHSTFRQDPAKGASTRGLNPPFNLRPDSGGGVRVEVAKKELLSKLLERSFPLAPGDFNKVVLLEEGVNPIDSNPCSTTFLDTKPNLCAKGVCEPFIILTPSKADGMEGVLEMGVFKIYSVSEILKNAEF